MPIYTIIPANNPYPEIIKAEYPNGMISFIPLDPANSDYQAYLASQENN